MNSNSLTYYTVDQVQAILDDRQNLQDHCDEFYRKMRIKNAELAAMIERHKRRTMLLTMSWSVDLGPNTYVNS
jgi:hypothetical protein